MKQNYQAPETNVLEIIAEQCILANSMEDPIEDPELDW